MVFLLLIRFIEIVKLRLNNFIEKFPLVLHYGIKKEYENNPLNRL